MGIRSTTSVTSGAFGAWWSVFDCTIRHRFGWRRALFPEPRASRASGGVPQYALSIFGGLSVTRLNVVCCLGWLALSLAATPAAATAQAPDSFSPGHGLF